MYLYVDMYKRKGLPEAAHMLDVPASKNLHACSFSISQPILFASILSLISLPFHVFNNKQQ